MRKFFLFLSVSALAIALLVIAILYYQKQDKKSQSPEELISFHMDDLSIKVFYNRPFKKDREIFGKLVPFGKVWRTGANEATTFETSKDLAFRSGTLKAGKYSLWTIPGEETWTIIFNREHGQWGINSEGEANRDPKNDVLTVEVPALHQERTFEQFTIAFEKTGEEAEMVLIWDTTLVAVPFDY